MAASIEERVIAVVAEQFGDYKSEITRKTSFVGDLGADSLDSVDFFMELEEEFDVTIFDEQSEKVQTVGDAIDLISSFPKVAD